MVDIGDNSVMKCIKSCQYYVKNQKLINMRYKLLLKRYRIQGKNFYQGQIQI